MGIENIGDLTNREEATMSDQSTETPDFPKAGKDEEIASKKESERDAERAEHLARRTKTSDSQK